jgi:hypothetical protein
MSSDHSALPITEWILDKVINLPEHAGWDDYGGWGQALSLAYYIIPAVPLVAVGALNGYAADEVTHYVVEPISLTIDKLAEVTGVSKAEDNAAAAAAADSSAEEPGTFDADGDGAPDGSGQGGYGAAADEPADTFDADADGAPDGSSQGGYGGDAGGYGGDAGDAGSD